MQVDTETLSAAETFVDGAYHKGRHPYRCPDGHPDKCPPAGPGHAHLRKTEMAEYQKIITKYIDALLDDSRPHRNDRPVNAHKELTRRPGENREELTIEHYPEINYLQVYHRFGLAHRPEYPAGGRPHYNQ